MSVNQIKLVAGVDSYTQGRKLKANPQFNPQHILGVVGDGKNRDAITLPVEEVGMWLCGIEKGA